MRFGAEVDRAAFLDFPPFPQVLDCIKELKDCHANFTPTLSFHVFYSFPL